MKRSRWWVVVYALAIFIVLGRLGNALNSLGHFLKEILKIQPVSGAQSIGFMAEGLFEDLLVALSIWSFFRKPKLTEPKGFEPS